MNVVVIFVITLPLTTAGVLCASVPSLDVTNVKMAQWQSDSHKPQEKRDDQRLLKSSLLSGRGRLKRNSDDIRVCKDALFTSPNTAYLQKHQTHRLRCSSWRHGERLSSAFWFKGSTPVAKFSALKERGENFTDGERYQLGDKMGLIIQNITDDDRGLYDCRVLPTATEKERNGLVTVEILDSTFPADDVSMVSINMKQNNINRQNDGRIECPHSTTDAAATYWSLDKGEGIDTDIIGAEYSNKDTLVFDKFKEDYQIASGGDLEILSLQRPQSRFWCHRFQDGSMVVGYIDVTGVVVVNQDQPIITGCENLPGDDCQVNFDPDKDIQLTCSVLKVYPKATLDWIVVSKCVINLQEESLESFDDVSKTYDQYQQLTVKAGSFAADCQPKFVCSVTGIAIPVQPFSAEAIQQVKSGFSRVVGLPLLAVIFVIMILSLIVLLWRKGYFAKKYASSANIEANEIKCDDTEYHLTCPDESKTLQSQTSQSDEIEPAKKEHIEIHPSDSNSFSPRNWLMQGHNIVVHIHQYVGHRTPSRNTPKNSLPKKKHAKRGTTYQTVCMETDPELFSACQQNLEVQMPENSSSPPLSKPRENDPQQMSFSGVACEHLQGQQQIELDEVLLHRQVSDEANSDPYLTQVEVNRQQEDPPEISISEAACEPLRIEVPQQDVNEVQPQQHISDKANSDPHPVNRQQEDSPEISISEDEACPSDSLLGAPSKTMTSTDSDARGQKQSTAIAKDLQDKDLQEENQQSNGPGPSPVGLGKNSPKRGQSDGEAPMKESERKKKKKSSKSKIFPNEESESVKPNGVDKQATRLTKKPTDGNIGNETDEETESDDVKDQPAAEERSTDYQPVHQVAQPVDTNDCSALPNPEGPLLDPTTNQHTDDVQHPHRGVSTKEPDYNYPSTPAQQADLVMKQPSHLANPVKIIPVPIPACDNSSKEAGPSDSLLGAPSETMTSTASDARGLEQSTAIAKDLQDNDLQEESQRSNGPGPSAVGLGKNSPKRAKSDGKSQLKEKKRKKKKKPSKLKKVQDEESDSLKPKGVGKQTVRLTKKPTDGNIGNETDEETESVASEADSGFGSIPSPHLTIQPDDAKDQPAAEEISTDQPVHQQVAQHVDKNDCSALLNHEGPLLDPTTNQHTDDSQHPHGGVPTIKPDYPSTPAQQADAIMKQPSPFANPFQIISAPIPAGVDPSKEEPDPYSICVPDIPQTRTQPTRPSLYTSPGSNTMDRGLDDLPNIRIHDPSPLTSPRAPLAAQDDHSHVPLSVSPPQSDYSNTTPGVVLDSNGSTVSNPFQSDDEEMGSVKSGSGNEMEDEAIHDVSGDNQQLQAPSMETDEAAELQKVCPPDAEIRYSSEEEVVVERPTQERKERQSTADNLRRKQNPLKKENILDKRTKALAVK